jgi:serine/threonine protein kinase
MSSPENSPAESTFTQLWEEICRKQQPPTPEQETLLGELLLKLPTEVRARMIALVGQFNNALQHSFKAKFAALELFGQELFGHEAQQAAGAGESELLIPDSSYRFTPGFRLGIKLGDGGNAVVYQAALRGAHAGDEPIAVKIFRRTRFTDQTISKIHHVAQEQNLHRLTHPGIVRILTAGDSNFGAFVAMEWVPGQNLKQWMETNDHRPVDPLTAARIVAALASATQAIHDRGLIHRDIKPGNILGCREKLDSYQLKLGDFGTSCIVSSLSNGAIGPQRVEGTIGYMPPEQLIGKEDRTADVFALGMVLVCLLTAKSPMDGERSLFDEAGRNILRKVWASMDRGGMKPIPDTVQNEYVALMDPRKLTKQIPAGETEEEKLQYKAIQAIVERCMSINPNDRYQSASALEADLINVLDDRPIADGQCEYTCKELVALYRRRLRRPEDSFEQDRRSAWGVSFMAIALMITLLVLLQHTLVNFGVSLDQSIGTCDSLIKVGALIILFFFRRHIEGFGASQSVFLMIVVYTFAAWLLTNIMFGLNNHSVIAPSLFLLFGVTTTLLGLLTRIWKLAVIGSVYQALSPCVYYLGQHHPDLLEGWGFTGVMFLYITFLLWMAYAYGGVSILRELFFQTSSTALMTGRSSV